MISMRFAYFYLMEDDPHEVRAVAPNHAQYWRGLALNHYLGGPFADRSGGLITFGCDSAETASRLVASDPFQHHDLVREQWLQEWKTECASPPGPERKASGRYGPWPHRVIAGSRFVVRHEREGGT
jgi:uncharacterized protein YciI